MSVVRCKVCNTKLESSSRNDTQTCGCSNKTYVSGGTECMMIDAVDVDMVEVIMDADEHNDYLDKIRGWRFRLLGHALINNLWVDSERMESVVKGLVKRQGQCPCRISDTKCPCPDHLDEVFTTGKCHCGLFMTDPNKGVDAIPEGEAL